MADPFTIVGLAAGLASLGIQVCGGITTYLDGIKCQADDIASVKRQVQSLESVLQAVRTTLPRIDSSHQVSTTAVVECLRSFEAELETLGKFVSKLTADIVTPTKFKDKVKEQTKKLTYPFNRSKLNQLEARLVQVNGIFQTSLQGLDLGISSSSLKTLEANSRATSADLLVVRSGVELSNNTLPSIQQSVDSLAPLITSQTETLSSQIENSGIRTQDTIQRLQGDFQSLVLHQLNRIEQSFQRSDQSNYARLERIVSELYSQDVKGRKGEQYQTSDIVVGRLIAKPNNLGSLCNEFSSLPRSSQSFTQEPLASFKSTLLQSSVNSGGASYIYGRRKRRQRQRIRWGPFEFYDEHTLTEENLLDSNISKAISRHRSIGLKYMGAANLLSRAINIAFSMSSGAGGFSIAPSFTYYATVDGRTAPAFRLLNLLHGYFGSPVVNKEEHFQGITETVFEKIFMLYRERRASYTDVDFNNRTILHIVGYLMFRSSHTIPLFSLLLEFFQVLLRYGVPTTHDIYGVTPHDFAFPALERAEICFIAAAEAIIPRDSDFSDEISSSLPFISNNITHRRLQLFRGSQRIAEAYGCGPLSLAILRNENIESIEHILLHHPSTILETNMYGMTPFHLASDQPEYLQLLLRAADVRLLDSVNRIPCTVMHYVLGLSGTSCHAQRDELCGPPCPCTKCLELLFHTDCALSTDSSTMSFVQNASLHVRLKYAAEVRNRREKLKRLALQHFTYSEIDDFGLNNGNILDSQTTRVIERLQIRNVPVPTSLGVNYPCPAKYHHVSLYQFLPRLRDAEIFFSLGFRDFNTVNELGFPMLAAFAEEGRSLPYLLWLSEHGAQLYHRIDYTSHTNAAQRIWGATSAHSIFGCIGRRLSSRAHFDHDTATAFDSLQLKIMPVEITDECHCRCSLSGCSPFLWMLKNMVRRGGEGYEWLAHKLSWYIRRHGSNMTLQHHKESIRFITFEALSIQHTCCNAGCGLRVPNYDEDNVQEIEEDQASVLENLEQLVLDLEDKVTEILGRESADTLTALSEFWMGYWCERIGEVLNELDGCEISPDEKAGAEVLGVKWENNTPVVIQPQPPKENQSDVNYWYRRINEIA